MSECAEQLEEIQIAYGGTGFLKHIPGFLQCIQTSLEQSAGFKIMTFRDLTPPCLGFDCTGEKNPKDISTLKSVCTDVLVTVCVHVCALIVRSMTSVCF